ncbi:TetR/AcrR family transcriptional regulator [Antrihabitans cavernicola]|uniref:TetR/AcrR family transcriptional regulator n=1 Tax=Antrihabitans cavernicola TaxID=2495913 RepID=A0A5A7S3Q7_9NOCA|nr:TetR/AcrR family transcriptional regulator [Spelaeibacter cavernicola]KAA0017395.1 TetR/AcrR family transcriptional regulator [Spelaeibacter cavernicola]
MQTSRARQAEDTRARVLATARRLIAEHGYDATSLQQIADDMGVTKANVYYYFRTKDAILEALLAPMVAGLDRLLDRVEGLADQQQRVTTLTTGFVDEVVRAFRALGHLGLGDPGMRRNVAITRTIDDQFERALRLLFGETPTPDQIAAYAMNSDLAPALRRLQSLPDDQLRDTLVRHCLRNLRGVM